MKKYTSKQAAFSDVRARVRDAAAVYFHTLDVHDRARDDLHAAWHAAYDVGVPIETLAQDACVTRVTVYRALADDVREGLRKPRGPRFQFDPPLRLLDPTECALSDAPNHRSEDHYDDEA